MNRPSRLSVVPSRRGAGGDVAVYAGFGGQAPAHVEAALERILASRTFRRSERHKDFLRHVVRAALDGRHDELKEVVIGIEVFRRDVSDYDPRQDPIVRVEAGRVRDKLARYYADEGVADAFEIRLPVGGYLPQLARRAAGPKAPRSIGSFAVLPFASLSSDPADAIFCEALADQLIDALSRVPGARVVGRASAAKARGESVDVKVVARLLGVGHVVEGSVQRAGDRRRCLAQLFRARDRACLWSQRFDLDVREPADLFAFQDRVTGAVVEAVERLDVREARHAAPFAPTRTVGTVHPEARDLYERARYLVQQRSTEGLEKGVALLERSIALDPDFAPAHTQLGIARSTLYGIHAVPTLPASREVERCARRALDLDPNDGDARALIANIAFRIDRDWPRAEALFREALQVAPNCAGAHQSYAAALVFNGRYPEALEHARIALDLDPLNITVRIHVAVVSAYARDYRTAVDEFHSILDLDPDHVYAHIMLGSLLLWAGDSASAMTHFEHAMRVEPAHPIPHFNVVFVHGFDGDRERARRMLDELIARLEAAGTPYQRYNRAMAEAFLGDVPAMCATLRRVATAHELLFMSVPADPSFDPYRDDPAFVALIEEFGLPRLPPSPFATSIADAR